MAYACLFLCLNTGLHPEALQKCFYNFPTNKKELKYASLFFVSKHKPSEEGVAKLFCLSFFYLVAPFLKCTGNQDLNFEFLEHFKFHPSNNEDFWVQSIWGQRR